MFHNLIESGSHKNDLKRTGSFFLGTLAFYAVLLMVAGVGSIYAYNASLDQPDYDIVTMMRFAPPPAPAMPERRVEARPAAARASANNQQTTRPEISIVTPYHSDRIANRETREVNAHTPVRISPNTSDAGSPTVPVGPVGPAGVNVSGNPNGVVVRGDERDEDVPTMPRVRAAERPAEVKRMPISLGPINSRAIDKPVPPYPPIARAARASGTVVIQILLDETGKVVSAQATSGHPLLRQAAVQAAYRARFTPTMLGGQPMKVTGFITYNFVLQ